MNPQRLLQHFDKISEAPDAVAKLRKLILDLAVRGKLVEQDAGDEPALAQLGRIELATRRLIASGIKTAQRIAPLAVEEQPFEGASGWVFVRLGSVLRMVNGRAFRPVEWVKRGLPIIRIQNLNNALAPFNFCDSASVDERHMICDGDFLISWSGTPGTSFGAFIWGRGPAALNQHIFRCAQIGDAFAPEFLRLAINSQLDVLIGQAQGGVGLQHVTKGRLEALPLPLPPIAEQRRIVAKVDELMVLCDQLQAARDAREQQCDLLVAASLHHMTACNTGDYDDATELPDESAGMRFHLQHLSRLSTRQEHIKQLRQTILDLAVRGRLVAQSSVTLRTSNLEQGATDLDADSRIAMQLPENWRWALIADIADARLGKMLDKAKNSGSDYAYLGNTNVHWFNIRSSDLKSIKLEPAEAAKYLLENGDVLICEGGHGIGRAAVWRGQKENVAYQKALHCVRPKRGLDGDFFSYCVHVYFHNGILQRYFTGVGIPHFTGRALASLVFPLPPLAEQHRIVAKVDELMTLCDQLEASLASAQNDRTRLLDVLLHEALQGSRKSESTPVHPFRDRPRRRAAVSCYLVSRLAEKRGFGRVAHMKQLYLAEAHLGLQLEGVYVRQAAGPLDTQIYDLELQAKQSGWFTTSMLVLPSGQEKVVYRPAGQLAEMVEEGIAVIGDKRAELDRVIGLLGDMRTDDVEIVATLFAAWNDALIDGHAPTDAWVINEVRDHWHVSKQRFEPHALRTWLGWMTANALVPTGISPRTVQQTTLDL